ncbi:hypothetical protein AJ78_07046 [Emergomyces pasteurianus Ep9510]|uniref:Cell surface protein n=1 Tax=Emergomyces pasteurianus Ep9510 TaxID=1447872 RepID=A0A1J9PWT5_9EURO|nr:hypothetical protein AJ78_07046 [Emergomyces pasteurianus Ep9510]
MPNIVNKVKDAVTGHPHHTSSNTHSTTGVGQESHGTHSTHGGSSTQPPHSSNVANKLDPRVDSQSTTGVGHGTHGTHSGVASSTHPPHSSNVANKLDPRVTDENYNPGTSMSTGTGLTGHTALPHEVGHMSTAEQSSNFGDHSHMGSGGLEGSGSALGTGTTGRTAGHHGSGASGLMQTDPVPASGTGGGIGWIGGAGGTGSTLSSGTGHHTTSHHGPNNIHSNVGSGTASRTAGPHDSNVANKLDPRVDSDLDNSRTVGGNATHHSRIGKFDNRDPTDAAQVPPSVMSKHIGAPEVAHDDLTHERERRHSVKPGDSLRGYGSGTA